MAHLAQCCQLTPGRVVGPAGREERKGQAAQEPSPPQWETLGVGSPKEEQEHGEKQEHLCFLDRCWNLWLRA